MPLPTTELAERVGEAEQENLSEKDICTISVALYHDHLPRLEEADVVSYDEDDGIVHPGPNFDILIRTLESVNERGLSWSDG